jgi:hypothetical protein
MFIRCTLKSPTGSVDLELEDSLTLHVPRGHEAAAGEEARGEAGMVEASMLI